MWDVRYRPLKFGDVLGQSGTVQLLKARLAKGTALDVSYIFAGGHGQGKCVTGDTLVPTSRGVVPIRELMGTNQTDPLEVGVVQETGTSGSAYSYRGGLRDTLRFRTYLGFELEGTPNHRIRVMQEDGTIGWRRLDELQVGDFACIVRRGIWGTGPDLSRFEYTPKSSDHSSVAFQPPCALDERWGRLLGYLVGDGSCTSEKSVSVACAEDDVKRDIMALLAELGGSATDTPDKRRPGLSSLKCSRKQFRAFLAYLGLGYGKAGEKTVPWSVMCSPEPVVRAFLRAYFECDGTANGFEALTKSPELARQVQVLLSNLGIMSRRFPKKHKRYGTYWRIKIMGTSLQTFADKVGFVSARKQSVMQDFLSLKHAMGRRSLSNKYEVIPHQTAHLAAFYESLPKDSRNRETSHFFRARRGHIPCTDRQLKRIAQGPYLSVAGDHFAYLHDTQYFYDPVVAIEQGKAEVYDLNVPVGESFSANGFMNHNTTLARIHARAMLCLNLDKADPEPCNECENCLDVLNGQPGAYVEQDAASGGTIDNIRTIVEDLPFAVFNAAKRVYVFDEAHRMSKDAQDVLLKPLEEKKMVGVFCTTEPEKIRGPIRSRCEEYAIRKITREDVLERMNMILDTEGVQHEDDAVLTVIDYSGGHVRDVVNRLEMVAQMGHVTLENVREYLQLSVVATYYEVLLALGTPKRAVELVEELCARVSPEDVSAGLAEAAMNAFRLRHGMFADFVYVDKALGQRLYEVYGDGVVRLAEHFLRQRYTSKVSLLCDVLNLSAGIPAAAPVILVRPQETPSTPVVATFPAPPVKTAPAPPLSAEPVATSSPNGKGMIRTDGVGSLGSDDVAALTDVDHHGVPRQKPRGRTHTPQSISYSKVEDADENEVLSPDQWRREFELTWPGRQA